MTRKKIFGISVAGISIGIIYWTLSQTSSSDVPYSMEVIEVNDGYGYQVSHNNHIVIFQPFIPAISGKRPFKEKEDAQRVGQLVMRRMKTGENYTVTQQDLDSLRIGIK